MKKLQTVIRVMGTAALLGWFGLAATRPQDAQDGRATFTIMTFNIQHGIDGAHKYGLQRAVQVIARARPDLVALQEVTRNHPYYQCEDQPARLAGDLTAATGQRWTVAYEQEWFTFNVECQQSGRGDGRETEGLAFLARAPLGATMMTPLPVSRIGFAAKLPAAGGHPIVVTHLASGRQNADARRRQVEALLKWADKIDAAAIVGDLNLKPEDGELQPMARRFRDAWAVGSRTGLARGSEGTHGNNRIDYVFYRPDLLELLAVQTIDTSSWFAAPASDHRPVTASFRVRRGS